MNTQQSNDSYSRETPVGGVTTNPFDDSSDDDDTYYYRECNEDHEEQESSLFSEIIAPSIIGGGDVESISLGTSASEATGSKRVAPLSFDVKVVEAKPALNFKTMQRFSQKDDFLSPLETALINRVDHLKSSSDAQDSEDESDAEADDMNDPDVSKDESYFSRLKGLSTYFVSTPAVLQDSTDNPSSGESKPLVEKVKLRMPGKSFSPTISTKFENDTNRENVLTPLAQADDVLQRMDAVKSTLKKGTSKRKRKVLSKKKQEEEDQKVLKTIESHPKDSDLTIDHRHAASPWNRLIILEELGTASSWLILLLPYFSFMLAIMLDSHETFWESSSGTISAAPLCNGIDSDNLEANWTAFPMQSLPDEACSYRYKLEEGKGILSRHSQNFKTVDREYEIILKYGVAFTSGPIEVPVLSSFLYGDIYYSSLSSSSVSLITDGFVQYSSVVFQQRSEDVSTGGEWLPVSISKPRLLSMLCEKMKNQTLESDTHWSCQSPKNVDVLFASPDTSVLTGGKTRVDTIISYAPRYLLHNKIDEFRSERNDKGIYEDFESEQRTGSDPDDLLLEIARSVSYQFTSSSKVKTNVSISVRIVCLLLSIIFTGFWFWSMGITGFFVLDDWLPCVYRPLYGSDEETLLSRKKKEVLFWECPWILFPERRYLLLLLCFLFLLQNPVLSYMYFYPTLYSSAEMHVMADLIMGIGFHGLLFTWLCLCQGLRYHTASHARKRADHQKQILELRRATKYLASSESSQYNSCASPSDHLASYFDEFGDLHGTTAINIRLKHDPCGDGCVDFLLPKVLLFLLGICAAFTTSVFRYSCSFIEDENSSHNMMERLVFERTILINFTYNEVFVLSSLAQLGILSSWGILIVKDALRTGVLLRKEPFLSTRPAQLAYRVLMSILVLGVTSFLLPFLGDWSAAQKVWRDSTVNEDGDESLFEVFLTIIVHATQRFPYSGTAASLGPGEMIYVTTATLVLAFIFLPSTSYILDDDQQGLLDSLGNSRTTPKENQRRDKRAVLSMSKYTHTWRTFPLPIEHHLYMVQNAKSKVVESYQVDKDLNPLDDHRGRGMIYKSNYVPLFCVETALWLAECSWQTYYSTTEYKTDDFAPGIMNLDSVGLALEADIYNEKSDTRAFVASNISAQIDGERDSIIVVAFRGTASSTNLKTDFNWGQETLPEHFINDQPEFRIDINSSPHVLDAESGSRSKVLRMKRDSNQGAGVNYLRSAPIARLFHSLVHSGFIKAYATIRDEIMEKVIEVMTRQINNALDRSSADTKEGKKVAFIMPKIYVTGHSLGGSLAQLLALDISVNIELKIKGSPPKKQRSSKHTRGVSEGSSLRALSKSAELGKSQSVDADQKAIPRTPGHARRHSATASDESVGFVHEILSGLSFDREKRTSKSLRPPIAVYTFGQPRVGNHGFSKFYKSHVPHTFRVISEADAITSLPLPTSCPPALYKHAGLEVIIDEGNTGNILVGPTIVETLFRFSKVRTSMYAHLLDTYRNGLESAFTQDELQEFYRTHGVNSRSLRSGYNTSDILPDWVTHITRRDF